MATIVQGLMALLARLMLTAVFVVSLVGNKIPQFSATVAFMQREGVPLSRLALVGAIGLLLIGGISVILGAWTRIGAACLLVFLVAATYFFHDFWAFTDALQREQQTIHFLKNVAIGGGLLMLVTFGAGPWSVDGWIEKKQEEAEGSSGQRQPKAAPRG